MNADATSAHCCGVFRVFWCGFVDARKIVFLVFLGLQRTTSKILRNFRKICVKLIRLLKKIGLLDEVFKRKRIV